MNNLKKILFVISLLTISPQYINAFQNDTLILSKKEIIKKKSISDSDKELMVEKPEKQADSNSKWTDYLIPISLGLFAGLIALYQVKLNNITAAKIKWSEDFRAILSSYLTNIDSSAINLINLNHIKSKGLELEENSKKYYGFYEKYSSCTDLATQFYFQLKLLINRDSEDFVKFESILEQLDMDYGNVENRTDIENLRLEIRNCLKISQEIIKKEWK